MEMDKKKLPSIFSYTDFRKFLHDYQKARHEIDKSFYKSEICWRMGLPNSRSYFNDVLKGKPVTTAYVDRFISVFELDPDESSYFRLLVKYNQTTNNDERELYFRQLISLNKIPKKVVDFRVYEFYRKWYHVAIRTLLDTYDFSDNYAELAKELIPQITVKQAKESIELLVSLGLISKNEDGFYKPTEKALATDDYVKDELIKQYQFQCIELAGKALFGNKKNIQDIYTNTISISKQGLQEILARLKSFKSEVCYIVNNDKNPADQVFQLNVQLFANSRKSITSKS
ncbi:MAG: TIGR02147 family protein [Fibrobacter sp.]|nr:TIGR02147 family protein [Fibrobacter sp.]